MLRTILASALLAWIVPLPAFAQGKPATAPQEYVHWASSWKEALSQARERNVPILVTFHEDG